MKNLADLTSDHLSLDNSCKISTQNMMVLYSKLKKDSIKSIQIDKVNIKMNTFPNISDSKVLQEVIIIFSKIFFNPNNKFLFR